MLAELGVDDPVGRATAAFARVRGARNTAEERGYQPPDIAWPDLRPSTRDQVAALAQFFGYEVG